MIRILFRLWNHCTVMMWNKIHVVRFNKMLRQTILYKYMYYKIKVNLVIRGHHMYKGCWTPIMEYSSSKKSHSRSCSWIWHICSWYYQGTRRRVVLTYFNRVLLANLPLFEQSEWKICWSISQWKKNERKNGKVEKEWIGLVVPGKYLPFTKTQRMANILHFELKKKTMFFFKKSLQNVFVNFLNIKNKEDLT